MNTNIQDIRKYNDLMTRGIEDKLFFLDYFKNQNFEPDTFIDYGCADGFLLSCLPEKWRKVGIDLSLEMIKRAKSLSLKKAHFFCSGSTPAGLYGNVYCFSSVLHEVYSYNSPEYIDLFWKNLQNAAPEYIIIRDMATTCQNDHPRSSDLDVHKIQKKANAAMLAEFESKYGSIDIQKNLAHFLLKYRYVENWKRELQEDYFAVSVKEISSRLGSHYDIVYQEEYVLPFIHDAVMEDFGIDLRTNTHMKLILKEIR